MPIYIELHVCVNYYICIALDRQESRTKGLGAGWQDEVHVTV